MHHQKSPPDSQIIAQSDFLHSFSIEATGPAIDTTALDTVSHGDLFGASMAALLPAQTIATKPIEAPKGRDRRAHPRHDSGCIVAVLPQTVGVRLSRDRTEWLLRSTDLRGQLVDVSMTGLAMRLSQPLERDSTIALRISNPRFDHHVDSTAGVLRCERDPEEGWQIVCRFERSLSFQQLHQIGRHLFASTIV